MQVVVFADRGGDGGVMRKAQAQVRGGSAGEFAGAQHALQNGQHVFRLFVGFGLGFQCFHQLQVNVQLVQVLLGEVGHGILQQGADLGHTLIAEAQVYGEAASA